MFPESYTKFYALMAVALVLGFIGMEVVTSGVPWQSALSGMATHTVSNAGPGLTTGGTPGSNLLFLGIGVLAGAVIVGSAIYIYTVEKKKIY
jgi:hypothetical protein